MLGDRHAQVHHRHQRLAAGHQLRRAVVAAGKLNGLRDAFGAVIGQRGGLHAVTFSTSKAFSIAARTRRGVIGVSLTSAPILRSASRMALAIAAGGEIAPPSPMPFMPYSVCGVGVLIWPILIAGISGAPGRR